MTKAFEEGREAAYTQARGDVVWDNELQGIPRKETTEAEREEAEASIEVQIAEREIDRTDIQAYSDLPMSSPVDNNHINVLDKGYVRLIDSMGSDLSVVNAARVSFDKESKEFNDKDDRLIRFLVRENHTAPFRHAILTFEVYAPLFVARQWWKHVIGGDHSEGNGDQYTAWNESSRRYVTENEEFYGVGEAGWRSKPENNKQGSGDNIHPRIGHEWSKKLDAHYTQGLYLYQQAMAEGIAPEQARLFLSANALYVRWRWTSSLQGVMHFINLRDESHAQWEIQQYAKAVKELAATKFPVSIGSLDND